MKARALLEVDCSDKESRDSLRSVLAPDNEGGPRGLGIRLERRARKLSILIEADSAATAMSTGLAFLRDIALFQEVWLLSQPKRG